ncbi:MAG: 3-keto-5-aminohexanoate cleavage protein [Rhodobacterales bacterium]
MPKPTLMVAPNGARKQKTDHPALPLTIPQIAQCADECFQAGADALHLHVRENNGTHSLDPVIYQEALAAVHETVPAMPIQITTESAGIFDVKTQLHCLKSLLPDAASISIHEIARAPALAPSVYGTCHEAGTQVQHILYDTDDVARLRDWIAKGWIPATMNSVIFVLGKYQPVVLARPSDLQTFLDATKDMRLNWMVCAFGQHELACAREALKKGGNLRIGFENNIQLPNGSPAKSNAQTVALAATLIKEMTHE